jgi:hypothetical protein
MVQTGQHGPVLGPFQNWTIFKGFKWLKQGGRQKSPGTVLGLWVPA